MLRGFVYSFLLLSLFLIGSIIWITFNQPNEATLYQLSGWLILIGLFGLGPGGFFLGYWHHRKLNPDAYRWDPELKE